MKAIALRQGADNVELLDLSDPEPQPGQVILRALRTGICGTDREIILRKKADPPPGQDFLVLGHESIAEVVAVHGDVEGLHPGDLVVPIVRRGCGRCNACNSGNADYCYTGGFTERGIHKEHGFLSEFFIDWPSYLIKADPSEADVAVLTEPLTVSVKAYGVAKEVLSRAKFHGYYSQQGKRERALVAGHGPIGLLGMLLLLSDDWEVYVLGRRPKGDFQRGLIESLGARYLLDEEADELVKSEGGFLLIFEATGLSEVTFHLANYLSRNGVLALTGIPRGPKEISIDSNSLMAQLVRHNQAIIGSVNACAGCFRIALKRLMDFKRRYPTTMDKIITNRFRPDQYADAFGGKRPDEIKVVVEFQ